MYSSARPLITFLTDFGLAWGPVGICKSVIHGIAPHARVVDLSHEVPPFNIAAGAWVLASAVEYTPVAVHVAVVDPGVGTERAPLALRAARGDVLIGPDNGLLIPAAERLGGVSEARLIENRAFVLASVSHTFHGRDIFSPAAAHLAAGASYEDIGPAVDAGALVPAPWRAPRYSEAAAEGEVVLLDQFGNVRTNLESSRWPLTPGRTARVRTEAATVELPVARTFGELPAGQPFAYEDSSRYLCIAVNLGSAGAQLGIRPGHAISLQRVE